MWVVILLSLDGDASRASFCVSSRVSAFTSHVATDAPSAASWMTSSRPMPVPPPVTTANLSANDSIGIGN